MEDLPRRPSAPHSSHGGGVESQGDQGHELVLKDLPFIQRVMEGYVRYSMVILLYRYIRPKSSQQDPEPELEAHASSTSVKETQPDAKRRKRTKLFSKLFCCLGVVLVLQFIILPVVMIPVGTAGYFLCPSNSSAIPVYLIMGGVVLVGVLLTRCAASCMTCCCKNRNCCKCRDSLKCTAVIGFFEACFFLLTLASLGIVVYGTYSIFVRSTPICSDLTIEDCCSRNVYGLSAFFNVLQYLLYVITFVYTCAVVFCTCVAERKLKHHS